MGARRRLGDALLPSLLTQVRQLSTDAGATRKSLWRLYDGTLIESVLMRYPIGSPCACPVRPGVAWGARSARPARVGLAGICPPARSSSRSLPRRALLPVVSCPEALAGCRNVVFMGMGEPLANYRRLVAALHRIVDSRPDGLGMSQRSVTVSTVGLVPAMGRLAEEGLAVTLAVSLHAPDDELRDTLVPINTRWRVAEVLAAADALRRPDRPTLFDRVRDDPGSERPGLASRSAR